MNDKRMILLFDGYCTLCNSWVDFVIKNDSSEKIKLGSIQSDQGQQILKQFGYEGNNLDTLIFIESGECYERSTAALKLVANLDGNLPYLKHLIWIPKIIRDSIYKIISKNRYKWFGKTNTCRLLNKKNQSRFLK